MHLQFSKAAKPLIEDSVVIDIKDGMLLARKAEQPLAKGEGVRKGACHCESVRQTAKLENAEHVLCHCSTCQNLGGGPYSCHQIIPREGLKIIGGEGNVGEYKYQGASGMLFSCREGKEVVLICSTGKFVHCYFCRTCTSHIYNHQDVMPDKIIVRTYC